MIKCPNCNEEIDSDSFYCDQCGQKLQFCVSCGEVGLGKRCTRCGGGMGEAPAETEAVAMIPVLTLSNNQDIRFTGVSGALIGRKQGPYSHLFCQNRYVSGVHAQLVYKSDMGWCVIDKHSSNGTKINNVRLSPETFSPLHSGDILSIANVDLTEDIR